MSVRELISSFSWANKENFLARQSILSFDQFLELFLKDPDRLGRNTVAYITDMLSYFRSKSKEAGKDSIFEYLGDADTSQVIGQINVENKIQKLFKNFKQSKVNKLILLHGPNGSSKSSIVELLFYGMEKYSEADEGAIFRFNWLFPVEKLSGNSVSTQNEVIGFSRGQSGKGTESFAFLDDHQIASKLICELKDNPIYLIPKGMRKDLLEQLIGQDYKIPDEILSGSLCKKCQQIFENLLAVYKGELSKVLRHIQVERFHYSKRYRVGLTTIEPQMHVDAAERQVTMDNNFPNLPSVLQNIRFFEPSGDLIDANRGIIEYSDLLKRPLETYKYLLSTVEKSTLKLSNSLVYTDLILIGNTNEKHLDGFKQSPDFSSFKGRIELITVPYLMDYKQEAKIYQREVAAIRLEKHIAPHVVELLGMWAVLTRVLKPNPSSYPSEIRALIGKLKPIDKVRIYSGGVVPVYFSSKEKITLRKHLNKISEEMEGTAAYEGRFGVSPRELKILLLNAAQNKDHICLDIMALIEEIRRLIKDKSVYEFLQIDARDGFHDHEVFLKTLDQEFFSRFEMELFHALDLFDGDQQVDYLKRYIDHVNAYVKNEKLYDELLKDYQNPDENMMGEFETKIHLKGDKREFRQSLISKIAASKIDNPERELVLKDVFADYFQDLNDHYLNERRKDLHQVYDDMMLIGSQSDSVINQKRKNRVEQVYQNLQTNFGYCEHCAKNSLTYLIKNNYSDKK